MTLATRLLPFLLVAALAAATAWWLKPAPPSSRVVVPDQVLLEARPSADRSLVEKITTKRVRPTRHAVSIGRPDTARIRDFCTAADAADPAVQTSTVGGVADSSTSSEVRKPAASLLPPFAGRVSRGRLELHATLSSGRLWAALYPIGTKAEWLSSGDSAIVTTPRQLLGLLELDPGVFAEAQYFPVTRRLHGRAGLALGGPERQIRAGVSAGTRERADLFVGVQLQR